MLMRGLTGHPATPTASIQAQSVTVCHVQLSLGLASTQPLLSKATSHERMAIVSALRGEAVRLPSVRVIRGSSRRRISTQGGAPLQRILDQDKYGRIRFGLGIPQTKVMTLDDAKRLDRTAVSVEHHLIPFWSCRYLLDYNEVMQAKHAHAGRMFARMKARLHWDVAAVPLGHWCSGYMTARAQDLISLFGSTNLTATLDSTRQAYIPEGWSSDKLELFQAPYPKPTLAETNRLLFAISPRAESQEIFQSWEPRDKALPFICPIYMPMIKVNTQDGYLIIDALSSSPPRTVNKQSKLGINMPPFLNLGMLLADMEDDLLLDDNDLNLLHVPRSGYGTIEDLVADSLNRELFSSEDWEDPNIYPMDPVSHPDSLNLNDIPPLSHNFGTTEYFIDKSMRGIEYPRPSYFPAKAPTIDAGLQARRLARMSAAAASVKPKPVPQPRATRPTVNTQRSADYERRQKLAKERQEHERRRAAEHLGRLAGSSAPPPLRPSSPAPRVEVMDPKGYYALCNVTPTSRFVEKDFAALIDKRINVAWRQEAQKHHPDRGGDTKKATAVNSAYAHIRDLKGRIEYMLRG